MRKYIMYQAVCIVLLFFAQGSAQYQETSPYSGVGSPFFRLVVHKQFMDSLQHYKLHIVAEFLNDDMTFNRDVEGDYKAELELLVAIYPEDRGKVYSKTIRKTVTEKNFNMTNERNKRMFIKTEMELPTGHYSLVARSTDLNTNKSIQRKNELNLAPYSENDVAISDILFLQKADVEALHKVENLTPSMTTNFEARSGYFYIYCDLYTKDVPSTVNLRYKFEDMDGDAEVDTLITKTVTKNISSNLFKIDKNRFLRNRYVLKIFASKGNVSVNKEKTISFFWSDVPLTEEDIDMALRQMVYIIEADSLEYVEELSLAEKTAFFIRFWKERDPNPNTAVNELKNEYFHRINYSNRQFTAMGHQGWKTDRGRILIKFGQPDEVERHPFEMDTKPYIIWRYNSLRKIFLFQDRSGFGDYYIHPNYLNVEFE